MVMALEELDKAQEVGAPVAQDAQRHRLAQDPRGHKTIALHARVVSSRHERAASKKKLRGLQDILGEGHDLDVVATFAGWRAPREYRRAFKSAGRAPSSGGVSSAPMLLWRALGSQASRARSRAFTVQISALPAPAVPARPVRAAAVRAHWARASTIPICARPVPAMAAARFGTVGACGWSIWLTSITQMAQRLRRQQPGKPKRAPATNSQFQGKPLPLFSAP